MATNTLLEKVFYHKILNSKDYIHFVKPKFFESEIIREAYKIASEFYHKYLKAPTKEQLFELVKLAGKDEKITGNKINAIYNVDLDKYGDDNWLKENIEAWIEYKNLDTSVFDLINYLQTTKVGPENIKNVVNTAKSLIVDNNNIDFNVNLGLDFYDPASHIQPEDERFSSGINFIDTVSGGGYESRALWVLMGPPKVGKCEVYDTLINIRNKKTGEVKKVKIGDIHKKCMEYL